MSTPASIYGRVIGDLVDRLSRYAQVPLDPETRATAVFCEVASTPCVWPLDDVFYELLLTAAGFQLDDGDHIRGAIWATALLVAADPSYAGLYCGHGDQPSVFCEGFHDADLDQLFGTAMDIAAGGAFDPVYEIRIQRCAAWGITEAGDEDGLAGAA